MGKQILETQEVKLIKHLLFNEGWKATQVQEFIPLVSKKHIYRIKIGVRWNDTTTPEVTIGRELFYRYLNKNTLRNE